MNMHKFNQLKPPDGSPAVISMKLYMGDDKLQQSPRGHDGLGRSTAIGGIILCY